MTAVRAVRAPLVDRIPHRPRLIVLDVDDTLVPGEVVDEVAARAGRGAELARITAAAMRGELADAGELRARVAGLAGLPVDVARAIGAQLVLDGGSRALVGALQRAGYRCGVVSSAFTQVIDPLATRLFLDFTVANTLEVADGRLTGRLVGPVVDRAAKARALAEFAGRYGVPRQDTVAVGDGLDDLDLLRAAGFGIAIEAPPAVRAQVSVTLERRSSDAVLEVLGLARPGLSGRPSLN